MKSRGFTLTELLAVIVVLAILVGIAVPTYYTISNNTKKSLYENKIEYIRIQAIKYAEDHDIDTSIINVATLITDGYIGSDSKSNEQYKLLVNPYPENEEDQYLDCYIVDIIKGESDYSANVRKNNDCNSSEMNSSVVNIFAFAYDQSQGKVISSLGSNNNVDWTKNDVLLYIDPSTLSIDNNTEVKWSIGGSTFNKKGEVETNVSLSTSPNVNASNVYVVSASLILNTDYIVSFRNVNGFLSGKGKVKIDKEKPILNVDASSSWTNSLKKIVFNATDGMGSGVYKYFVATSRSETVPSDLNSPLLSDNNTFELPSGTYYGYVIDRVGNVSNSTFIDNNNVLDTDTLRCVDNKNSLPTNYVNYDVVLEYGCSEDSVGCHVENSNVNKLTKTYTSTTGETFTYVIVDNLGKSRKTCSVPLNIKIDKVKPTCTNDSYTKWTSSDRTVKWGCSDTGGSNCTVTKVGEYKVTTSTKQYEIKSYTISDKAGNSVTCPTKKTDVLVDKAKPTISAKANPLTLDSRNYTFTSNLNVKYGISSGSVSCNPSASKKTGEYNVTCTAKSGAGLTSSVTFKARHSVAATKVTERNSLCGTESYCSNWGMCDECYAGDGSNNCYGMCGSPGSGSDCCVGCRNARPCCRGNGTRNRECTLYKCPNGTQHLDGNGKPYSDNNKKIYSTSDNVCHYV